MNLPIEILFEDEHLLAVNKPAGILTIQDGYDAAKPFLSHLLSEHFGRLWVVHRLDRDTSGVLLFARNAQVHRSLSLQFERRQVQKIYHLITYGHLAQEEIEVTHPLRVDADRRHRTVVDPFRGKPACTIFRILKRLENDFLLLEAQPLSGYTHQIRAHLSALGLQILGDKLYKPHPVPPNRPIYPLAPDSPATQRVALHAFALSFRHPQSPRKRITLMAPYPSDFTSLLEILIPA
ncbi:RluA family pseudouridine synthase [uncultured Thermanaerothrix sp.]|uniref:RluA family pseudouridine synthase n=1 Tax=uncultured Thermanaerothrix sp. TaxID=1195149 RepID=UPI00263881FF|nr:RluA family pseudouridine synthase [uncultured Thermanaerothrix sp.]